MQKLASVEDDKPANDINDAKCDRMGRLWFGTMSVAETNPLAPKKIGSLYSFDGGENTVVPLIL